MAPKRIIGLLGVVSITVLLMAPQAEALLYKAFSKLCLAGALQAGLREGTLIWTLESTTVECLCVNEQTGKVDPKPGKGNLGTITEEFDASENASRDRRFVFVDGCIEPIEEKFIILETHYVTDAGGNQIEAPGHQCEGEPGDCVNHVCGTSQPNKIEIINTCLFNTFTANWELRDLNGKLKLSGRDKCRWRGFRAEDGTPITQQKNCEECSLLDGTCDIECTWECDETVTKPKGGN